MNTSILFHAAQLERCKATYNNIRNLIKENENRAVSASDLGELLIHVIFNGDAVKSLTSMAEGAIDTAIDWETLPAYVMLFACENSLRSIGIAPSSLPDYVHPIPSGIYAIITHQKEGFHYVRP